MTANISSARRFRESIRSCEYFKKYQSDIAFRECLEYEYEKVKTKLAKLLSEGALESVIKGNKNGLFLITVGLFTFGRLDVAQDILDNIPGGSGSVNHLAGVITKLLPLPKGLSPRRDTDEIKEWLTIKHSRLRWDESLERYILENFKILSDIPNDYNCEEFSAKDNLVNLQGLVVEIQPDTGSNWVGNFQAGKSDFSGVYQHPNSIDLIIVSRGQGYIINPENRQLLETFGGCIFSVIDLPQTYYILFQDTSGLLCYDSSGFLWQNTEITWDILRGIKVTGNILSGEFYRSNDDSWASFWLNIETGSVQPGEYRWEYSLPKRPWWQFW